MNYLEDADLWYQIKLSKGKGKPTKGLERMIILIARNLVKKKIYYCDEEKDVVNEMVLRMLQKWMNFSVKYDYALPFMTEVAKRAMVRGWMDVHGFRQDISSPIISVESFHNL